MGQHRTNKPKRKTLKRRQRRSQKLEQRWDDFMSSIDKEKPPSADAETS